ncbi:MAG: cytochrome c biogenesis protein DipZ [Candidatus Limnocylindrales bacterium]
MILLLIVAFIAGVVTAVSPCVLPVLPIILATGTGGDRRRPYLVIAGLIASFSFFTLASVQIIEALRLPSSLLRDVAIAIVAVFGLTLLVPALSAAYERATARIPALGARMAHPGVVGGLVTGVGLGLVWTPCAGPILGAVTSLAVTAPGSAATVALVVAYALGAGLPLLAIALGGRTALERMKLRSASPWAGRALGALVLVTAGLMAVGADTAITADLTSAVPDWTGTLQALERTQQVQSALSDLGVGPRSPAGTGGPTDASGLPDLGPAAEFTGIDSWLNSKPLTIAGLRGKVVLVDFWTYSCVNCIRTLPYVESWYQKYASQGLVIVGVHTPEFAFEHDAGNVAAAIARFGITYPVAQDNEYATWNAYANEYWPADYLIDATGHIRNAHFGEGDYVQTEDEIRALLAAAGAAATALPAAATSAPTPPITGTQTPETYVGTARQGQFSSPESPASGSHNYTLPGSLAKDSFAVSGAWDFQDEYAQTATGGDQLELSFYARDVYLVMAADSPVAATVGVTGVASEAATIQVTEDVAADGSLTVGPARLYHLVHLSAATRGTVTITFQGNGARAYAFTFGS